MTVVGRRTFLRAVHVDKVSRNWLMDVLKYTIHLPFYSATASHEEKVQNMDNLVLSTGLIGCELATLKRFGSFTVANLRYQPS